MSTPTPLFIAMSTYLRPLDEIADALAEHREWVEVQYSSGVMLASGPFNPRTGGVMILRAVDGEQAAAVIAGDPFAIKGLASYDIHEFQPTPLPYRSPELESFLA